jgi:N-acetylmuramoyl-L-alanine amidase
VSYPIDHSHPSPNHAPRGGADIKMIVLHATVGSGASALAWLTNPASRVSSHYLIYKTGSIYQLVADSEVAWHAGKSTWHGMDSDDIARGSLGIELENANTGRDPYPPAQLASARWLCQTKIARYTIERGDVVRHLDIAMPKGRKTDPAGLRWPAFADSLYLAAPAPGARDYDVIGLPVYEQSDRKGKLYGYLLAGEHVTIDDLATGHLADNRGFIDINGLVTRPK